MIGKNLEVVVLGSGGTDDELQPEVWQTAPGAPFSQKLLRLE
jgi:hypothetical protein